MSKIVLSVVCLWLTGSSSVLAQLSKDKILELVEKEVEISLVVSLIEKDCVDFEMDGDALLELSAKLPKEVLQAALDCQATKRRPAMIEDRAQAGPKESLSCRIYRDMTSHPELQDFPAVIISIENGYLTVAGVNQSKWAQERGKGVTTRIFTYAEIHAKNADKLKSILRMLPEVRDVTFNVYNDLGTAAVAKMQREALEEACAKKGRVSVSSNPPGAIVQIGGKKFQTPWSGDLTVGDYSVEVRLENYAPFVGELAVMEEGTAELNAELEKLGELKIATVPSGARVFVDDQLVGESPVSIWRATGDYELKVLAHQHEPHYQVVSATNGQTLSLEVTVGKIPEKEYCIGSELIGSLGENFSEVSSVLQSREVYAVVPLYQAVTSQMERRLPSTHVVDGDRFAYEPKSGSNYVATPGKLLGRELGGFAFGETVSALVETAPGPVRVSNVTKKKNSVEVQVAYSNGEENVIYFDFSSPVKTLPVGDFFKAFCLAFSVHSSFFASSFL